MGPKIGESMSLGGEIPAATERNRRGIKGTILVSVYTFFGGCDDDRYYDEEPQVT
jgi:hypothetical protein